MAITDPHYAATIQPRFAAYLLSRGLPMSPDADILHGWQADFLGWIPKAKRWAFERGSGVEKRQSGDLFITNQEQFTDSCFEFARTPEGRQ